MAGKLSQYKEYIIQSKALGHGSRKIAKELGVGKTSINDYLRSLSFVQEADIDVDNTQDNSRILFISDLHAPYQHAGAVEWLAMLKDKYKPTRVISVGDECFPPEAEVLTDKGFVKFEHITGEESVAAWYEDGTINFEKPERVVVKEYEGSLLQFKQSNMVSRTTPKHNLVKIDRDGVVHRREAWDVKGSEAWYIPRFGAQNGGSIPLTDTQIQLLVAFQADGTFTKGAARFSFSKQRKFDRLATLLDSAGISFNLHNVKRGDFQVYIEKDNVPKYFTKQFDDVISFTEMSLYQKTLFLDELQFWDGTKTSVGTKYTSINRSNVDFVQAVACTSGVYTGKIISHKRENKNHNTAFGINIKIGTKQKTTLKTATIEDIPYSGMVYCVTVKSGMVVVRQDGHVSVSGNCDKHSLSYHDSNPDLYSAGHELLAARKVMKQLHDLFPVMDIMESNHGSLHLRKALTHGIPQAYIKSYNDILEVGKGWTWHHDMIIELPNGQDCYITHGKNANGLRLSQNMGMNVVQGHHHSEFGIGYWSNPRNLFFAMAVGCLINDKSLAMRYNKLTMKRPIIGTGLIIDSKPVLEVMPL